MKQVRLKSAAQINRIRKSGEILGDVLNRLADMARPGALPVDLDRFARESVEARGARPAFLGYHGYPASINVSVNDAVIHGIPGDIPLQDGDIVSLDMGVDLDGFISDSAITVAVGRVSEDRLRLMRVTEECLALAIEQARAGNRMNDIGAAVWDHATAEGYGVVVDYCGHGVGFAVHEPPEVRNFVARGPNPRLKAGMVLAIEPMINMGSGDVFVESDGWTVKTSDGLPAAHFEHTVAVTDGEPEILTWRS